MTQYCVSDLEEDFAKLHPEFFSKCFRDLLESLSNGNHCAQLRGFDEREIIISISWIDAFRSIHHAEAGPIHDEFSEEVFRKRQKNEENKKKSLLSLARSTDPESVWDLENELGDGAYGKVFKAALKCVTYESESELAEFLLEVDVLKNLKHENILTAYEFFLYNNKLWMFLELCSCGALDSIMSTLEKPLNEPQIRYVNHEVLSGLRFLHENLIIHRDLKAGNILINKSNQIKLADFGVSAQLTDAGQTRSSFIGTPYWMAPEVIQCKDMQEIGYNWKCDIWSLGITLIELAEMQVPHSNINPCRATFKIFKSDPPTLTRPTRWSESFNKFLALCLSKDASSRPGCDELLQNDFVRTVDPADESQFRLLLCEVNAEIHDSVELTDKPDEDQSEDSVSLPSTTSIDNLSDFDMDFLNDLGKDEESVQQDDLPPPPPESAVAVNDKESSFKRKRHSAFYRTCTRTRRFVFDGTEMTTTSEHVVSPSEVVKKRELEAKERNKEVAMIRMLHQQEKTMMRELDNRTTVLKEQLENKQRSEFLELRRRELEQKLETHARKFKDEEDIINKKYRRDRKHVSKDLKSRRKNSNQSSGRHSIDSSSSQSDVITQTYERVMLALQSRKQQEQQEIEQKYQDLKRQMEQNHLSMRQQFERMYNKDIFLIRRDKLHGMLELELSAMRQNSSSDRTRLQQLQANQRKLLVKKGKAVNRVPVSHLFGLSKAQAPEQLRAQADFVEELNALDKAQLSQRSQLEEDIECRRQELELAHSKQKQDLIELEIEDLAKLRNEHEREKLMYANSELRSTCIQPVSV